MSLRPNTMVVGGHRSILPLNLVKKQVHLSVEKFKNEKSKNEMMRSQDISSRETTDDMAKDENV